jgi:tellurite methyltransferase
LSLADHRKWDALYRDGAYSDRRHPTALLENFVRERGRGAALDVACGAGRNALFLAQQGFGVDAIDISGAALERLRQDADAGNLPVRTVEADLDPGLPESEGLQDEYDLIVLVRYVNPPLVGQLVDRLAEGGVLLCEEHLKTDQDVIGPRNDDFRVAPGQLLEAAADLRVHFYREGIIPRSGRSEI